MKIGFLALLLCLSGGSRAAGDAAHAPLKPTLLKYDCSWLVRMSPRPGCKPVADPVQKLVDAAEADPVASHSPPSRAQWEQREKAIEGAMTLVPDTLPFAERIFAQNSALRLALLASAYSASPQNGPATDLLHKAALLVAHLALPAEKLDAAGARPDDALDSWIGPSAKWTEKRVDQEILFHENIYRITRMFRLVRAGEKRVIFGQLVAVDTDWRPHLTPIVGGIELRRSSAPDAPACVVDLTVSALRCGIPGGLRAREDESFDALGGYLTVREKAANCNSCHRIRGVLGFTLTEVSAARRQRFIAQRTARFLEEVEKFQVPVRKTLLPGK